MPDKTIKIEVNFPVEVDLPGGFDHTLHALIGVVCRYYEQTNPTRVMWVGGSGGKLVGDVMTGDGLDYDMSTLCIDVAEREDTTGLNPLNPNKEQLRKKAREERKARRAAKTKIEVIK